jgi:hypothetical protein
MQPQLSRKGGHRPPFRSTTSEFVGPVTQQEAGYSQTLIRLVVFGCVVVPQFFLGNAPGSVSGRRTHVLATGIGTTEIA